MRHIQQEELMIAAIALLTVGLQASAKNPYQVSIQEPVVAGQREIALGLLPHRLETVGLYHTFVIGGGGKAEGSIEWNTGKAGLTQQIPMAPQEEDVRIGSCSWSVRPTVVGSKLGSLLETDATRNQHVKIPIGRGQFLERDIKNFQKRSYFVGDDGKIISERAEVRNEKGYWAMEATYGADSYDLRIQKPGMPEVRSTVTPGCGMDALHAMFKPMLKGQDVVLKEKEFYMLDPYTGAPQKHTAKVAGRFGGKFSNMQFEGRYVDITGPVLTNRAFLSYEGELMRVDAPGAVYLHIEIEPENKPTLRHKKDGGT